MKVEGDHVRCAGYGLCELHAADGFEVGEDGLVQLLIDDPPGTHWYYPADTGIVWAVAARPGHPKATG